MTSHRIRPVGFIFGLALLGIIVLPQCSGNGEATATKGDSATTRPGGATRPSATQPAGDWKPPKPKSAGERVEERREMVETTIAHPMDRREPVRDERVLEAMRTVPRHVFMPAGQRRWAYADRPLPIGHRQTISQPYIVAFMTELLKLTPNKKVLEIGTGSGYQAAVLAHMTPHVYSIELLEPLAERAKQTLREQGYTEVELRRGDGFLGWPDEAPFDAIILTCAIDEIPDPLWQQLEPGGRIVMPLGDPGSIQQLVVVHKTPEGERKVETIMGVGFVPLVREKEAP